MSFEHLPPWEALLRRILMAQLGDVRGLRVLDFGSGAGVTADHLAAHTGYSPSIRTRPPSGRAPVSTATSSASAP